MARLVPGDERGSAVTDFVMVSALVVFLFTAVLQIGLVLHVRNTLISCASEGARLGARADSSPGQGAQRTRELIAGSVNRDFADRVRATTSTTSAGVEVVVVEVEAPFPVLGLFGPDASLDVSGRAFAERQ